MRFLRIVFFSSIIFVFFNACGRDTGEAKKSEKKFDRRIYSAWQGRVLESDTMSYKAELAFKKTGEMEFIYLRFVPGRSDFYSKFREEGSAIVIYEDTECKSVGKYEFTIINKILKLKALDDPCEKRRKALEGGEWVENK